MKRKRQPAHLENSRPKEQHDGEFSGLCFCVIYAGLDAGEAGNPERPMAARKAQEKPVLSLVKGPEKRQSSKTENF